MSTPAEPPAAPVEKFRKDYKVPPYRIDSLTLDFDIHENETLVTASLTIKRAATTAAGTVMELDGEDVALRSIEVDGAALQPGTGYEVLKEGLRLLAPPAGESFTLKTTVAIKPQENTQLSGLYKSSGNFVTQCEAEGFRRITYFQDRPDVMATYRVRVEADKAAYPLLLSNGNEVGAGDVAGKAGRHFAEFVDPFRKPSYLFALVAGKLEGIEGTFKTMSGREVRLALWSEPENIDQLDWALQSLKDAMTWDEKTYAREYDLDVYHIVAVNDFNMGAMENKGLNVFNTSCVLAKPSTATDSDYARVQGVVAHEYFHNWTGNRVTCQDWFQLTLKEGLTVFRDQTFSADMTSEAVKRIEDVRILRAYQFPQDSGPMAHPIRPDSYVAMDNFYTVTVYNKGAEVIRMYRTLLGVAGFRKGMDLYFERHDGQAVACDDFRAAMADANGADLAQFERWYTQAGTPTLEASGAYDAGAKRYTLTLAQSTPPTPGQPTKEPFHIPVSVGLLAADGSEAAPTRVLELREAKQEFHFDGIDAPPTPSLLRGFSAPVKLVLERSDAELAFLAAHDLDEFNRWDATQTLASRVLLAAATTLQSGGQPELPAAFVEAFRATLGAPSLDRSLKAEALTLPGFSTLAQEMDVVDPDALCGALRFARAGLAQALQAELEAAYAELAPPAGAAFELNPGTVGRRALRNVVLGYLAKLAGGEARCVAQLDAASCMTEKIGALAPLAKLPGAARDAAFAAFYARAAANKEALVINKWFALQASADVPGALASVRALLSHEAFDANNPNRYRAVVNMFAGANPAHFHAADGTGYAFVADETIAMDKRNPQVAARLAGSFNQWKKFDAGRQALMKAQLERIKAADGLSKDTFEIVSRALK